MFRRAVGHCAHEGASRLSARLCRSAVTGAFLALLPLASVLANEPNGPAFANQAPASAPAAAAAGNWDVTAARGKTRDIDFVTSEGTWMSADLSSDGRWIAFDLLGHIYRMQATGGEAVVLTQDSGIALNFQPRISPDGGRIAFVSDRGGQHNLWVMNADGSNPRPIVSDVKTTTFEPTWTPDGKFLIVRKSTDREGGGGTPDGLWMYPSAGGGGVQLVGGGPSGADPASPSVSSDGKYLYYQVTIDGALEKQPMFGAYQIRRLDLRSREVLDITAGEGGGLSSGGGAAPEVSPNGRWLAFARQIPDGVLEFKGHRYGPRTSLWLRDLQTGEERLLMDPIEPGAWSGKASSVLPRYRWSPDGESILITQGGKFRRVDIATRSVATVPFSAKVHRTTSQMARKETRIRDDVVEAKYFGWPTATRDGRLLAYQAVGRIYLQSAANGRARRATPATFRPLEFSPALSPDGRWLAFVTWDDAARGHLWKVSVAGGAPQRLSESAGEYANPVWSPDGQSIVVMQGEGATARGRSLTHNAWFDVVTYSVAGSKEGRRIGTVKRPSGASLFDQARRQLPRPSFGPDGRIFWQDVRNWTPQDGGRRFSGGGPSTLVSVKPDGSDRQEHLYFRYADEITPSPDGQWVAFQEGDNVYVAAMDWGAVAKAPQRVDKRSGAVTALTRAGGVFPHWRDKTTLEYASGSQYLARDMGTGRTAAITMAVSVPKAQVKGSVAITNVRIITLAHRQVIERGTLLIKNGRIACVGSCDTASADRVIDGSGKTVIPGFVDVHAHHYRDGRSIRARHDYEQAIYLAYGVTTTLDPSAWSMNALPAAELADAGEILGPRGYSTGDNLLPNDSARNNDITDVSVAINEVRKMAAWGATAIKQYQQPRRDQRQWLAEAARQVGVNITSEGRFFFDDLASAMDGQTGWEHAFGELPMYSDGAKFFGQAGITFSATLIAGTPTVWGLEYWDSQADVWKDEKLRRWYPWRSLMMKASRVRKMRPETDYSYPLVAQAMADIIAAGGWGAMGAHGEIDGLGSHWEVWMGAKALGPMGALEVASLHSARFIGIDKDVGSLEVGKLADLMILNANPLEDIRNTVNLQYVMKGGRLYDAATLDEVWPKQTPFGPYYWVNEDALQVNSKSTDIFDKK